MVGGESTHPPLLVFTNSQADIAGPAMIPADTEFLGFFPLLSGHSADSVTTPCDSDLGPETKNCRKHNRRL